jgi:hypothetical protein
MGDEEHFRSIEIYQEGDDQPVWVIRDHAVPLPGDQIGIEQSDGSTRSYTVVSRTWLTAKQGEHSFARVRLTVKGKPKPASTKTGAVRGLI